jgi:hypothetical protein
MNRPLPNAQPARDLHLAHALCRQPVDLARLGPGCRRPALVAPGFLGRGDPLALPLLAVRRDLVNNCVRARDGTASAARRIAPPEPLALARRPDCQAQRGFRVHLARMQDRGPGVSPHRGTWVP